MDNKINLIIDFDSTFIKLETIEVLADFALKNKKDKKNILELIKKMTNKAMQGEIPFSDALYERINLINLKSRHIDLTINYLMNHITTSFIKNKKFFELNHKNCFIISGGFKEIIIPIVKNFNIPSNQVYANSFIYENNKLSLDKNNPLSKNNGKNIIAKNIPGYNIVIGDGFTDYEVKKNGNAKKFIQFTENIDRKKLNAKADLICTDFKCVIDFINNDI